MTAEDLERVKAIVSELEEHLSWPPHQIELSTRGYDSAQIWDAVIKEVAAAGWEVDHSLPPRLRIKRAV